MIHMRAKKYVIVILIFFCLLVDTVMQMGMGIGAGAAEGKETISLTDYVERSASEESGATAISISSSSELHLFAQYVNQGNDTKGKTFVLSKDISLSDYDVEHICDSKRAAIYKDGAVVAVVRQDGIVYESISSSRRSELGALVSPDSIWEGIGTESNPFQGTFDGNGHSIQGMICVNQEDYAGLFSVVGSSGAVKNVAVNASLAVGGKDSGGIAGKNFGLMKECNSSAIVMGSLAVGGVAGNSAGELRDCVAKDVILVGASSSIPGSFGNYKDTDMDRRLGVGGVVGVTSGTCDGCWLTGEDTQIVFGGGGIAGFICGGTVQSCTNCSDIDVYGAIKGGIACFLFDGEILDCENYGDIAYAFSSGDTNINLAGILAVSATMGEPNAQDDWGEGYIARCFNYGCVYQVKDEKYSRMTSVLMGGIVAELEWSSLYDCGNYGVVKLDNQMPEGMSDQLATVYQGAAGISARCHEIRNCYNVGNISGDILNTGGIVAYCCAGHHKVENAFSLGKVAAKGSAGEISGRHDMGVLNNCYYLSGDDRTLCGSFKESADTSFSNCTGLSEWDFEDEVCDKLNQWVAQYSIYYVEQDGILYPQKHLKWSQGEKGYPVLNGKGDYGPAIQDLISGNMPDPAPKPTPPKKTATSAPEPTATPAPQITPNPTISPSSKPTGTPSNMPSSTPKSTTTPVPSEISNPGAKPTATPISSNGTYDYGSEDILLDKVPSLRATVTANHAVKLSWKKKSQGISFEIFRCGNKKNSYKKIAEVSSNVFLDMSVKKGKTYQYKICSRMVQGRQIKRSRYTYKKGVSIPWYAAPKAVYNKEKSANGKRYLRINLKKYCGNHLEIYVAKKGKKYRKVHIKSIKKYRGVFRLSYSKKMGVLYCRLRTYKIVKGKRRYSDYSKRGKIKL